MKKTIQLLTLGLFLLNIPAIAQDAPLKEGRNDLAKGNYQGAKDAFTKYNNLYTSQLNTYLKKKAAYDTSNAFVKSSMYADFKVNHNWASGYSGLGVANLKLGQKDAAAQNFATAIKIDPTCAEAHYNEAMIKKDAGDKLGTCIEIGLALTYNDTMKAAREAYRDNFCSMTGEEYFKKGQSSVSLKDYATAMPDLRMATMICPDSGNFFGNLGMAYDGLGKPDSAVDAFARAIKVDSNSFFAYYYRGIVYEEKQKHEEAFQDFSKAIKLNPRSADVYIHRAEVCENMEKEGSAIYDYQQVVRLKPDDGDAWYKIALYHKKQKQTSKACDEFAKAASLGVDDAQSYVDDCKAAASKIITK